MLGKLIKYEFKYTSKTMLITYAALAVATLMGSLAFLKEHGTVTDGSFSEIINIVLLVLYIIAIISIYCVDFIYLCYQYYKTMYSSQGYLTHTLPVSPAAVLGAKIAVFFVWMLLTSLLSVLSVVILLQVGSRGEFFHALDDIVWSSFSASVNEIFGMSAGVMLTLFCVISLLGIPLYILWITASMAIGQLFHKNRTAACILAAFCFYMANQILNTVFLAVSGYSTGLFLEGEAASFMHTIIGGSIVMTILFIVVLYGICLTVNKRKLNLE